MIFRFLFNFVIWLIFFYLIYTFLRRIFNSPKPPREETQVKGKNQSNPPLDLSEQDVEDAVYREIKKGKKSE